MNTQRLNITLPRALAARLRAVTNKSRFIAEALSEKFGAEQAARLSDALAEAYREESVEERKLADDWDAVTGDGL